jgi:sugar phosphate isomerase/epimerase
MKLSLSNFAWDSDENEFIFKTLSSIGIENIEGVLTKINNWDTLGESELVKYKESLNHHGIKIESIQSIFYGVSCNDLSDYKTIDHYRKLIEYCNVLGVKVMVLGSPSLRKNVNGWYVNLSNILKEVDNMLNNTGVELSIEPNTKSYGGDYFHTVEEIVDFIVHNDFKNIKTMVDTHNLKLEDLDPINNLKTYVKYINHIHVSEPKLSKLTDFEFHIDFAKSIKDLNYDGIVTYEVTKCDDLIKSVEQFYLIYNNKVV